MEIIKPYVEKVKEEVSFPAEQKALLIWYAFKGQQSQVITAALNNYNLVTVMVPKNLTHLLQPLDLTTNSSFKKMEKVAFRDYFTNTITRELEIDPEKDVTTIKVNLTLLDGWKAAAVVRAVEEGTSGSVIDVNPFF